MRSLREQGRAGSDLPLRKVLSVGAEPGQLRREERQGQGDGEGPEVSKEAERRARKSGTPKEPWGPGRGQGIGEEAGDL